MKSFISLLVLCTALLIGSVQCQARIPYSYLNIGGLTPDQQIDSAYYVYERPQDTLIVKSGYGYSIYEASYNSDLIVYYVYGGYNEPNRIRAILCAEDNIATNLGIRVGMTKNDVLYAYGEPDRSFDEDNGSSWCYLASSEDHPNMPLWFFFDKNDVIYTITAGDISYY